VTKLKSEGVVPVTGTDVANRSIDGGWSGGVRYGVRMKMRRCCAATPWKRNSAERKSDSLSVRVTYSQSHTRECRSWDSSAFAIDMSSIVLVRIYKIFLDCDVNKGSLQGPLLLRCLKSRFPFHEFASQQHQRFSYSLSTTICGFAKVTTPFNAKIVTSLLAYDQLPRQRMSLSLSSPLTSNSCRNPTVLVVFYTRPRLLPTMR